MNIDELKQKLDGVEGVASFMLDTKTDVKLKGGKKNPLQDRVQKQVKNAEVLIYHKYNGNGYEELVKEQMLKEGKDPSEFVLKPRAWGKRIENTPFVEHNEKYYLECIFVKSGNSEYLVDGEVYNEDDIEGLPEKKVSDNSQGGIESKIVIRTFAVDSILNIEMKEVA